MVGEIRYYRGINKVRVVTQSEGYWIVEALENFEDTEGDKKIAVRAGEQRILPPSSLFREKKLAPPIEEHAYELQMERKLKKLVAQTEKRETEKKTD